MSECSLSGQPLLSAEGTETCASALGYCVCRVPFVGMVRTRSFGLACLMCTALAEARLGKCEHLRKEAEGRVLCKLERACSFDYSAVKSVQSIQGCNVGFARLVV